MKTNFVLFLWLALSTSIVTKQPNVIVVLVDHKQFKAADKSQFAKKVIIDTRGII